MYVITLVDFTHVSKGGGVPRFARAINKNSGRSLKKIKSCLSEVKKYKYFWIWEKKIIYCWVQTHTPPHNI